MRIGIDPGVSGAMAIINDDLTFVAVFDAPTMRSSGKKLQVNLAEFAKMIRAQVFFNDDGAIRGRPTTAYVELVHSMPAQGVASTFNFGMAYGGILGILGALQVSMVLVSPQAWKKRAGVSNRNKDAARTKAQQLYPEAPLGRVKDIGRADALLIARFGSGK